MLIHAGKVHKHSTTRPASLKRKYPGFKHAKQEFCCILQSDDILDLLLDYIALVYIYIYN